MKKGKRMSLVKWEGRSRTGVFMDFMCEVESQV